MASKNKKLQDRSEATQIAKAARHKLQKFLKREVTHIEEYIYKIFAAGEDRTSTSKVIERVALDAYALCEELQTLAKRPDVYDWNIRTIRLTALSLLAWSSWVTLAKSSDPRRPLWTRFRYDESHRGLADDCLTAIQVGRQMFPTIRTQRREETKDIMDEDWSEK